MILERTFEWGSNYNEQAKGKVVGWRPIDAPAWFDHGAEIFLVHDTMEHLHPSDTSLEAEMRASGAGIAIRLTGPVKEKRVKDINEWADVLGEDAMAFIMTDKRELAAPTISVPPLPPELEEVMQHKIIPAMKKVWKQRKKDPLTKYNEEQAMARAEIARNWMRIGFAEASEVYGKIEPMDRLRLFRATRHQGEAATREHVAMDGDRIKVSLDTETGKGSLDYSPNKKWTQSQRNAMAMNRMFSFAF